MKPCAVLALCLLCAPWARAGSGDVDNDGAIGLRDAALAARMALSPAAGTAAQRARADILPLTSEAGDGQVTLSDARFLLRVAGGLEANPAWLTVPVYAYQVCDDDGSRCAAITRQQVVQWVSYATTAYQPAGVRLTFAPSDFQTIHSTLLNGMTGVEHPQWTAQKEAANALAAQHPQHITVFIRRGGGASPTGGGFSWWDYNFAVMPGFNDTGVCGHQNIGLFGHELGHYLGLPHTFAADFGTVAQAESFFAQHGNSVAAFDGDGIADTPPDPFIRDHQCDASESVTLSGQNVPIARYNIMSYWETPNRTVTPQQGQRMRWMLRTRGRGGMAMPTNAGLSGALEADTLAVAGSSGVNSGRQDMSGWDASRWNGGDQLFCGAQKNGWMDLRFNVATAGAYALSAYLTQAPDFGIVRFALDGQSVGESFDAWSFLVMPSGRIPLGTFSLAPGSHTIRIESVNKNPLSTNYLFGVDCFTLTPRGGA